MLRRVLRSDSPGSATHEWSETTFAPSEATTFSVPLGEGRYALLAFGVDSPLGSGTFSVTRAPVPVLAAQPYLMDDVGTRFPRRALLKERGPLRVAPDGVPVTAEELTRLETPVEAIVVEEHARELRVVIADGWTRLAVFVPRTMLERVSTRATSLTTTAQGALDPSTGVRIASGIRLVEDARYGSRRHVAGETMGIRFEGWIPNDALGDLYSPERLRDSEKWDGILAASTNVTTTNGSVLATTPRGPIRVESFDAAPAGFRTIRLQRGTIEVVGLVPADRYERERPRVQGHGSGRLSWHRPSHTDARRAILRAHAGLVDERGDKVGVALVDTQVLTSYEPIASDDRLRTIEVWVQPFGYFILRVRSDDLRPEEG